MLSFDFGQYRDIAASKSELALTPKIWFPQIVFYCAGPSVNRLRKLIVFYLLFINPVIFTFNVFTVFVNIYSEDIER